MPMRYAYGGAWLAISWPDPDNSDPLAEMKRQERNWWISAEHSILITCTYVVYEAFNARDAQP